MIFCEMMYAHKNVFSTALFGHLCFPRMDPEYHNTKHLHDKNMYMQLCLAFLEEVAHSCHVCFCIHSAELFLSIKPRQDLQYLRSTHAVCIVCITRCLHCLHSIIFPLTSLHNLLCLASLKTWIPRS